LCFGYQKVQELIEFQPNADLQLPPSFVLWQVHFSIPLCLTELWVLRPSPSPSSSHSATAVSGSAAAAAVEPLKIVEFAIEGVEALVARRQASSVWSMRLDNITAVNCLTNNIVVTCPFRQPLTPSERARMPEIFEEV
jgi:hypothetical protein